MKVENSLINPEQDVSSTEPHEQCEREECQQCCEHDEHDHFICLYCAKELDPGRFIDQADWAFGGDR